jgi:hypothetical protein
MCKWQRMIPRPQRSPRYRIAHCWKNEYGSWSWSPWKILKQLENPGRLLLLSLSLFFLFSFSLFFLLVFSFSSLFFSLTGARCFEFFLFYRIILFIFISPRALICIVPTSSPMLRRLLVAEQGGNGVKVGTGCIDERELESSLWSTFLWRVVSILKW